MKIKHLEKYILLLSFIGIVVLFILFSNTSPNLALLSSTNKTFSFKTKNGKTYFSLNRELSLLPGDFIHLTQDDGNNWTPFEIKAILLLARQEIRVSTSSGIISGTTRQDVILDKKWRNSQGSISLRKGKEVSNIKYDDILRISGPLWLLTSIDSKTIKNDQNQISYFDNYEVDGQSQTLNAVGINVDFSEKSKLTISYNSFVQYFETKYKLNQFQLLYRLNL